MFYCNVVIFQRVVLVAGYSATLDTDQGGSREGAKGGGPQLGAIRVGFC